MSTDGPTSKPLMTQVLELKTRISELELQAASRMGDLGRDQKLEARLRKAQKLESLAEMAVGLAHDFNNLLVAIRGNADLALTALPPFSEARVFVERIDKASQRATDLANQMLAYASKRPMGTERVDLNGLVREMADLLRSAISRHARLELRLADDLPSIEADATQIRQVVVNLIKNAAEALDGDGTVTVSTRALELQEGSRRDYRPPVVDPHGPYVCLEVADNGRGMDRETQAKLFDPFFTTKPNGHGLGLAAVLGIVRTHCGGIAIDSEPGKGTRFQVLLPAR